MSVSSRGSPARVMGGVLRRADEGENRRETEKHYMDKSQPAIVVFEDREEELGARELQELEAKRGQKIDF